MGINQFADMIGEEVSHFNNGTLVPKVDPNPFGIRTKTVYTVNETMFSRGPSSVDWNSRGHVTPVKDQGYYCNACWAFSVGTDI